MAWTNRWGLETTDGGFVTTVPEPSRPSADDEIEQIRRRMRLDSLYEAVDRAEVHSGTLQFAERLAAHTAAWLEIRTPRVEWFRPASTATRHAFFLDGSTADGQRVFDTSRAPIPEWSAPTGFCGSADSIHLLAYLREDDLVACLAHEVAHAAQFAAQSRRPREAQEREAEAFANAVSSWWSRDLVRLSDQEDFITSKPQRGIIPERLARRLEIERRVLSMRL